MHYAKRSSFSTSRNGSYYNKLALLNETSKFSMSNLPRYQKKSISQIRKENLQTCVKNRKYIETMYRSGNFFEYNLKKPHFGSHRYHLGGLENTARTMLPNIGFEKNRLMMFNTQCDNLRRDQNHIYNRLKTDLNDEVDNLEMKFNQNMNRQKVANTKLNKEVKELKDGLLDNRNLLVELKQRINSLKLRIDGQFMYNVDGIPVLDTKIE